MRYSGADMRVWVLVAGEYVKLPGERACTGTIAVEPVDTTVKDGDQWRMLTPVGVQSAEVSASGCVRDDTTKDAWNALFQAAFDGDSVIMKLTSAAGTILEGIAMIPTISRSGEVNGADLYDLSLSLSGAPSLPPAPVVVPDGDLYRVGEWASGQSGAVFVALTSYLPAFTLV